MSRKKHWIFYAVFTAVALSAVAATVVQLRFSGQKKLSEIRRVPDFHLVEQTGKAIALADLKGKVWLADFVYSTCPGPCPMISTRLENLQERALKNDDVRFVSFTVNPETDTPEILREYAARYHASERWSFVTGDPAQVRTLIQTGFLLAAAPGAKGDEAVIHSTRIALVDRAGGIRRYYDALNEKDETILRDLEELRREK